MSAALLTNGERLADLVRERDRVREQLDELKDKRKAQAKAACEVTDDQIAALKDGLKVMEANISELAKHPNQTDTGAGLTK